MNLLQRLTYKIRHNEPIALPLDILLRTASAVQRIGMGIRQRGEKIRVPARVISIGNLTVGGTGKTPMVIARAAAELQKGYRVAVLTRGYKGQHSTAPIIRPPGSPIVETAVCCGDEAALIAWSLPEAWIVRCANRVVAARLAIQQGCDVLILDDGFQAVQLERDENILLIDATNPFGNGFILPRGILREPVVAMRRATEIIITRCDQAPDKLSDITETIRTICPEVPVNYTWHKPEYLRRVCDGKLFPLTALKGASVRVICGIGNPEAFTHSVETLGATILETIFLQDHEPIPPALLLSQQMTLITEKDAVRLESCVNPFIYALGISLASYERHISRKTST